MSGLVCLTNEDMLEAIAYAHHQLGCPVQRVTIDNYQDFRREARVALPSESTIRSRFGSWKCALEICARREWRLQDRASGGSRAAA